MQTRAAHNKRRKSKNGIFFLINGFCCVGVQSNGVPRIWCKNLTRCSYHRTNYVLRVYMESVRCSFFPNVRRLAYVYVAMLPSALHFVSFFFYWEFTFCAVQWTHVQPHTRTSSSARYSQTWAKFPILNFWSKFKSKVFSDSNVRLVVSFFSIRQLHICHKCKLQMLLAFVRKPNLILHRFCDGGWLFFRSVKQTNE